MESNCADQTFETLSATDLLREAEAIMEDRAAARDQGEERSMARTVRAFNAITGQNLSETNGWLFMLVLKLGRAHGGGFHADDWKDLPGYAALAGECAIRENQENE
jgi:hypothetical protein